MTFRIHATAAALEDMVAIGRWISSERASAEAERWVESRLKALWSLAEMPERCALAPEDEKS